MFARPYPPPRNHARGIRAFFACSSSAPAVTHANHRSARGRIRQTLISLAVARAFFPLGEGVYADPDPCSQPTPSSVVCSGNQSGGVATGHSLLVGGNTLQSPPVTTLGVNALSGAIAPAANTAGIRFHNETGNALLLNAGTALLPISVAATGDRTASIVVNGFGTPTGSRQIGAWALPAGTGGNGGAVTINSFATITTDGNESPGISARSRAGGYPQAVVDTLAALASSNQGATFTLSAVQGDAANIGNAVTGSNGGTFTLKNGTFGSAPSYTFNLSGMALSTLTAGQHIDTSVSYSVASWSGLSPSTASLTLRVTRLTDGSLTVLPLTYFGEYGRGYAAANPVAYTEGPTAVAGQISLQPNYGAYIARLTADSAVGGGAGNVIVNAYGSITTKNDLSLGQASYGILAQSKSGVGASGGGGVFSGDPGAAGWAGGTVSVNNWAEIHTHGEGAHGIAASSSGGDGGRGGSTSFIGNGAAGGAGGKGGAVTVNNHGKITTESDGAFGILAQSVGGKGGVGGDGGWLVGGGGSGGTATPNDAVNVYNAGEITTHGDGSHGILAQNIGGFGGNSGSAVALVALSSSGGNAGTGGDAYINNIAKVTTTGLDANALIAQSIGGGGGSAGNSAGLVALGGDGTAGGNGGLASITNSGVLAAKSLGSVGIFAQSIGGGGGNGGNSLGLVPIGGGGATTSDGGTVIVNNSGKIEASSSAIFAESVGGGGGSGGSSIGWFAIGGTGGGGGKGGTVSVTNSGDLSTTGRNASALFAQSVGGGGGHGGNVVAVGAFASMAIGGDGGSGGNGDEVVVNSSGGKIETAEEQSHGIFAQSLGGKGGSGGFAVSLAVGKGLSVSLSVGGSGGGGGDGKHVQVDSQSEIITHKADAHGIFAQSVGGGGGTGGFAVSAAGTVDGIAASFAVGGSGGLGGNGGQVDVGKDSAVAGNITTTGDRSDGIFAQSVGGGGGHGGLSVAGNISGGGSGGGLSFSLGGQGGSGGSGMDVHVRSLATISTTGVKAYGIRAQSVGGGGGDGGLAVSGSVGGGGGTGATSLKFDFSIGGYAGSGGNGNTVDVDVNGGSITTTGKDAHGIFAQSVGGGGGAGGMAIAGTLGLGANNVDVSFAVGGKGGGGGIGKKVSVSNAGKITASGENAFGIFAQSIGGGGGIGGASYSGEAIVNLGHQGPNFNIGFAFGGSGGSGGDGGGVEVNNRGSIETSGIAAHGIFAESVGGGGGQGGSARTMSLNYGSGMTPASAHLQFAFNLNMGGSGGAAGNGNSVTVNNLGSVTTNGPDSHGIYAQSVGGGGGTGGEGAHGFFGFPTLFLDKTPFYENVSISMGGDAGAAGDGGTVTVNQCVGVTPASGAACGSITTKEKSAYGIFAQSVGGGGGTGGVGVIGLTNMLGIGGSGGASGDGGKVEVTANGNIDTFGEDAVGVYAQSVGGGGGIAGNVDRGINRWRWTHQNMGLGFGIVANSENGGSGSEVIVKGNGNIHTRGLGATAIFAQSVGGGGGVAGSQGFFGITGSAGGNGSGDKVTVDWTGSITTEGANAHGIYAQSAGGTETETHYTYTKDGVPVAITLTPRQNLGKDVLVDVKGSVVTKGDESAAIYAQSTGDQGNGNVTVKLAGGGSVVGGKTTGVGIQIVGGAGNLIENRGSVSALSGIAIVADEGNERVDNYGTITGNVDLGTGSNVFNNLPGSNFNPLASIALGGSQTLFNAGTLSPGGKGSVQATTLAGNLLQTGSGSLGIDLSLAGRSSDHLTVTGTAVIGGSVSVNPVDTGRARVGAQQIVVLDALGGATPSGLALNAPSSPLIHYALNYPSANQLAVTSQVDFKPRGLTGNAGRLGDYLNAVQLAGGSESLAPYVAALFGLNDEAALKTAYEKLGPGALGTLTKVSSTASLEFNDAMHSCRQRDGDYRFIREGECSWIRFGGSIRDQERNDQNPGYRQDMMTMAGGFQTAVRDNLHLGFGASYQQSALNSVFSDANGERFEGGMIVKQRFDATRLSLSFSAGYGHYNTRRLVDIATPGTYAQARPSLWSGALHGRISHDLTAGESAYVRPMLGLGIAYVSRDAYAESGAGGANLRVEKASDTFVSLHPAIEVGGENSIGGAGTLLRHYLRVGITQFLGSNERHVTASLEGAPSGVQPFTVTTRSEKTYADLSIGFDILRKSGTNVRLEYTGQFSNSSTTHAIGVKIAMPF